jgi:hypothetical protein
MGFSPAHRRSSRLRLLARALRNRNALNLCIVFDRWQAIADNDSRSAGAR